MTVSDVQTPRIQVELINPGIVEINGKKYEVLTTQSRQPGGEWVKIELSAEHMRKVALACGKLFEKINGEETIPSGPITFRFELSKNPKNRLPAQLIFIAFGGKQHSLAGYDESSQQALLPLLSALQEPIQQLARQGAHKPLKSLPTQQPGNCLFVAMNRGLQELQAQGRLPNAKISSADLRTAAAKFLKNHIGDELWQSRMDDSLEGEVSDKKARIAQERASLEAIGQSTTELDRHEQELELLKTQESRFKDYVAKMEKPGTWGSRTELEALSDLYNVNIKVERVVNGKTLQQQDLLIENHRNAPLICLRHLDGNHFEFASTSLSNIVSTEV